MEQPDRRDVQEESPDWRADVTESFNPPRPPIKALIMTVTLVMGKIYSLPFSLSSRRSNRRSQGIKGVQFVGDCLGTDLNPIQ